MTVTTAWNWQHARLENGKLVFDSDSGAEQAFRDGFFIVDQPSELKLDAIDRFAHSWHWPDDGLDPFRGYARFTGDKLDPPGDKFGLGYTDHKTDQSEQFILERAWWKNYLPAEMHAQSDALRDFTVELTQAVFERLDVPADVWGHGLGRLLHRTWSILPAVQPPPAPHAHAWAGRTPGWRLADRRPIDRTRPGGQARRRLIRDRPHPGQVHHQLRSADGDPDTEDQHAGGGRLPSRCRAARPSPRQRRPSLVCALRRQQP